MTRLEAGALALQREWVPLEELVGAALTRLEGRLGERPVRVALAGGLPLLTWTRCCSNRCSSTCSRTSRSTRPAGSAIDIDGAVQDGAVVLVVRDHGPGLKPGDSASSSPGLRPGP